MTDKKKPVSKLQLKIWELLQKAEAVAFKDEKVL